MSTDPAIVMCAHCGSEIDGRVDELGSHSLHPGCVEEFASITPKAVLTPFACETCGRGYWTEKGLERHREVRHDD